MNEFYKFRLELPDGWEDQTVYVFQGPEDSDLIHNISLSVDEKPSTTNIEKYAAERIDLLKDSLNGMEILNEKQREHPCGEPLFEVSYKWVPAEDRVLFQKQMYLVVNKVGYTFTSTFTKKTLKTIAKEVDKIIDSFEPGE